MRVTVTGAFGYSGRYIAQRLLAEKDRGLLADLTLRADASGFAVAVQNLPQGADDMSTLLAVGKALAGT